MSRTRLTRTAILLSSALAISILVTFTLCGDRGYRTPVFDDYFLSTESIAAHLVSYVFSILFVCLIYLNVTVYFSYNFGFLKALLMFILLYLLWITTSLYLADKNENLVNICPLELRAFSDYDFFYIYPFAMGMIFFEVFALPLGILVAIRLVVSKLNLVDKIKERLR